METATTTLTAADDGRTVEVRAGDTVLLRLRDKPGGFKWDFDGPASELLDVRDVPRRSETERRRTDEPGTAAVGGPADREWTLTARAPGTARVALKLWRQWEGDGSIQKRFGATVTIKP